jgi:hypothetical protein
MAITTVSDYVIWASHIHGDAALLVRVHSLWAGQTIELEVDGLKGAWRKMDDGSDGRPTPGIRPLGAAQTAWRALYKAKRGEQVTIREVDTLSTGFAEKTRAAPQGPVIYPPMAKSEEEREAAFQELMNAWREGWRSDGTKMTRDEMHER